MHQLFVKRSMDALNEALLKETEYPAADKTYKNPFWFKGTEPSEKTGAAKTAMPWNRKPNYDQLCEQVIDGLQALAKMTTNSDVQACASMSAGDLEYFINLEASPKNASARRAAIKMHEEPKELPPRPDLRSHLDEDLKEELAEETGVPVKHYKRFAHRPRHTR